MQKRSLGKSDVQITPILMGTWQAGKQMWVGIEDTDTVKAIRAAFDAGITTIDTAEVYGEGHSERIIAAALSDVRDQFVYATKVFANHLKYDQVIETCDRSKTSKPTISISTKFTGRRGRLRMKWCRSKKRCGHSTTSSNKAKSGRSGCQISHEHNLKKPRNMGGLTVCNPLTRCFGGMLKPMRCPTALSTTLRFWPTPRWLKGC
jgi:hypothetical protein